MTRPLLPEIVPTPPRGSFLDRDGQITTVWRSWFELMHLRTGGSCGIPVIGDVAVFQTTVGQAALAGGGTVEVLNALVGEQWKIREVVLSGDGTDFSGGGGDRLLAVTDGTSTWTVIPAATLQSLAAARWGDTGVPFPATASHLTAASVLSTDITAQYSGGTTDYTAGSLTLTLTAERVA